MIIKRFLDELGRRVWEWWMRVATTPNLRDKRVLIVVRAHTDGEKWNKELAEKLDWLKTLFYHTTWSSVLMMDSIPPDYTELCCSAAQWRCIGKWSDVYDQIMQENINRATNESDGSPFDFCLFLNIRKDRQDAGIGYGLHECRDERCILRACTLACNGNILFGDWGCPSDLSHGIKMGETVYMSIRVKPNWRSWSSQLRGRVRRTGDDGRMFCMVVKGKDAGVATMERLKREEMNQHVVVTMMSERKTAAVTVTPERVMEDNKNVVGRSSNNPFGDDDVCARWGYVMNGVVRVGVQRVNNDDMIW